MLVGETEFAGNEQLAAKSIACLSGCYHQHVQTWPICKWQARPHEVRQALQLVCRESMHGASPNPW